jgi:hypothetical protein
MNKNLFVTGIFIFLIIGSVNVFASDPPGIINICHFPIDEVSDDYISKEITSNDSVIILAIVYTHGLSNPPKVVTVYYNDCFEHEMEMIYSWTYFCYTAEIGQFKTNTTVTYYIEATDTELQTTTSDVYSFTVNDSEPSEPNEPPIISIISPKDKAIIKDTKPIIRASYSDSDGIDTKNVTLTIDDIIVNSIITATSINYTPTDNMTYGKHIVKLELSDLLGKTSTEEWSFTIEKIELKPEQVDKNDKKIPGFEILSIFFVVILFIFLKNKRIPKK